MKFLSTYAPRTNRDTLSVVDEILCSKSRNLIVITGFFFCLSAILLSGSAPTQMMSRLLSISLAFGLLSLTVYRLVERRYLLAHLIWQAGIAILIVTASFVLGRSEILLLIAFLPMIAAITLGFPAGLLAEVLVGGLVWWVILEPARFQLPAIYAPMILVFGAFGGLLGWATTNHLMTLADWSVFSYKQAQKNLEEAREQRLELHQTQEDLTKANQELARLADRLKALQRIAEEARQAKSEFVANVSHELRTPLNMIIGFTEVIARSPHLYGAHLPASLMTDITAIQRNSQHLLNLVNDVLDLSQVETGRMALSREWTAVPAMLQDAAGVVQGLFQSKGLYLKLEIAEALPEVFCDQTRVRQVVINLLSNAGRFTQQGGVVLRCHADAEQIVISVNDSGPGIPAEDQERIFEPFQQLDNSIRRTYGGNGLGLTISKQFVEMHEGKMWLTSKPGAGTSFYFSLPLAPNLTNEPGSQRVRRALTPDDEIGYHLRRRPSKAPLPVLKPRLVVVEKEQALQRLLRRYLEDTEISHIETLEQASEELNHSPAQALVVNIPPFETISDEVLARVPFGTPVISCWIPGEVEAARQLGVIRYLMKPLTREKLLAVLADLPREAGAPRALKNILVADDEPDELHLFARMLESAPNGYQVLQATNGKRALSMLRTRKPDVLLLDLVMPAMNGFQVLEEKRKDPEICDIPVLVISSRDPLGEAITGNSVRIHHNGGFSTNHLLKLIQTTAEILVPGS